MYVSTSNVHSTAQSYSLKQPVVNELGHQVFALHFASLYSLSSGVVA